MYFCKAFVVLFQPIIFLLDSINANGNLEKRLVEHFSLTMVAIGLDSRMVTGDGVDLERS
jgi:hypothetical protein